MAGEGTLDKEIVGSCRFTKTTSSKEDGQVPPETVQRKVTLDPGNTFVMAVVGEVAETMVADPLTTDQIPVPAEGGVTDIVNDPFPQLA